MKKLFLLTSLVFLPQLLSASEQTTVKEALFTKIGYLCHRISNFCNSSPSSPEDCLVNAINDDNSLGIAIASSQGANINSTSSDMTYPIEQAVEGLKVKATKKLLDLNCDLTLVPRSFLDVHLGSSINAPKKCIAIFDLLFSHGLSADAQDSEKKDTILGNLFQNSTLSQTFSNNPNEPFKLILWLIDRGASLTNPKNIAGETPLDILMRTKTLTDGEKIVLLNRLRIEYSKRIEFNLLIQKLKELLKNTLINGPESELDFIISHGLNLSDDIWNDEDGFSPFEILCINNQFGKALKIRPSQLSFEEQDILNTRLFYAVPKITIAQLKDLLKLGADTNATNNQGITAFEKFCFFDLPLTKISLIKPQHLNKAVQEQLDSALIERCTLSTGENIDKGIILDDVERLLVLGANPNSKNSNNKRMIDIALSSKSYELAKLLSIFGATSETIPMVPHFNYTPEFMEQNKLNSFKKNK